MELKMKNMNFRKILNIVFIINFLAFFSVSSQEIEKKEFSLEEAIDYGNISFENITQQTVLNAILQAERDMQEMVEEGFKEQKENIFLAIQ